MLKSLVSSLLMLLLSVGGGFIQEVRAQIWKPKANDGLTWQWQLQGKIKQNIRVDVYDVDLFKTPKSTIKSLQNKGKKVICYFSAGSYEGWRKDWKKFFPFIKNDNYSGNNPPFAGKMGGWDERWLDIRKINLLKPIMTSRIQLAVNKGCDAIEPDNMDAYQNKGEVKIDELTAKHQLQYNKWIANKAHQLGISVGLKNDVDQLRGLVKYFDFAVNEQCFQYNECGKYKVFTNRNKAVFGAEYKGKPAVFCKKANAAKLSFQKKGEKLYAWRVGCEKFK